jgi:hypothetical protein
MNNANSIISTKYKSRIIGKNIEARAQTVATVGIRIYAHFRNNE